MGLFDYIWIYFFNNVDYYYVDDDVFNLDKTWNKWMDRFVHMVQRWGLYLVFSNSSKFIDSGSYIELNILIQKFLPLI